MLGLSRPQGRLAVRQPRAPECLDLIEDLAALDQTKPLIDFGKLRHILSACSTGRDQIAHGTWAKHPQTGTPVLRITRSQWQPDKKAKGKVKRAIKPEGRMFDVAECQELLTLIKTASKEIDRIALELHLPEGP